MPSQNRIANYCLWSKWALITQRMTSFDYSKNDISLVPSLYGYGILKYFSKSRDVFTNSEKIKLSPVVIQFIKQVGNWRELLLSVSLWAWTREYRFWKVKVHFGPLGGAIAKQNFLFSLFLPPRRPPPTRLFRHYFIKAKESYRGLGGTSEQLPKPHLLCNVLT